MSNFNKRIDQLLSEMAANVAGGELSVTGPSTSGNYGNQFPSQNSKAYNDGDNRLAVPLGMKNPYIKDLKGKKSKAAKKATKVPIQRRGIYLPGM
jgi:hypothetical protein